MNKARIKALKKAHTPKSAKSQGYWYCEGCPQEDWGHRDFGSAVVSKKGCDIYQLTCMVLGED